MTDRNESLIALAERCEKATGPDRELDALIEAALDGYTDITERNGWISAWNGDRSRTLGLIDPSSVTGNRNFTPQSHMTPAYTASLDAAMMLVPEGLCWRLGVNGNPKAKLLGGSAASILGDDFGTDVAKAGAATPALALTAAALRARAAQ